MENFASDIISLLQYLLPGFLTAWIFYGFTSYQKPSQFERVVQALIFTLIVQTGVSVIEEVCLYFGSYFSVGTWNENISLASSLFVAILTGFCFSFFANTDKFHFIFRKLKITSETSYPSEWFGVFSKKLTYVVLHLNDERRVYGWPMEWPSDPGKGHFSLVQAAWLESTNETPLAGVDCILVKAEDVKWVEFMERIQGGKS